MAFDRRAHCQQIGGKGGQETARRYGTQYMRELAKAGFEVYAARYHDGNRAEAAAALRTRKPLSWNKGRQPRSKPPAQSAITAARHAA